MGDETIRTIADLTQAVTKLTSSRRWSNWWFRGHADHTWDLVATVERENFRQQQIQRHQLYRRSNLAGEQIESWLIERERDLNREFRIHGAYFLPSQIDLVDLYFLARHHGLPSRLLDWSANPLAALFYAVAASPETDGEVVAAMPSHFSRFRHNEPVDITPVEEVFNDSRSAAVRNTVRYLFGDNKEELFDGLNFHDPLILPILPDAQQARIFHQSARFTLHMPGSHKVDKTQLRRWTIPADAKQSLRFELRCIGIRWDSLFPDLDHVARELSEM